MIASSVAKSVTRSVASSTAGIASGGGSSLFLDTYTDASLAFSLRKLRNAYSGSAIRVRRSTDSAEQDIGFSGGDLNTTALLTFCGAGDGFVTTWYDQSGNSRNAVQATAASQPRIVSGGVVDLLGTLPALVFDGTNDFFTCLSSGALAVSPYTVFTMGSCTSGTGSFCGKSDGSFIDGRRRSRQLRRNSGTGTLTIFQGTDSQSKTSIVTATNPNTFGFILTSSASYRMVIGASTETYSSPALETNNANAALVSIGRTFETTSGEHLSGGMAELIMWETARSDWSNINDAIRTYFTFLAGVGLWAVGSTFVIG